MRRTAELVLLTCWPPAPDARKTSILMSSSRISMLISSSTTGYTNTDAKLVCRRACASNGEMRTSRWTPDLRLQKAKRVVALDLEHGALDARLFALAQVEDLDRRSPSALPSACTCA